MILPTVASLENISGLVPWLAGGEWRKKFAGIEFPGAGESLPCKSIRISDEVADAVLILVAYEKNAKGLRETSLYLHFAYDKQTRSQKFRITLDCDCGSSTPCLHAAAALDVLAGLVGEKKTPAPTLRKPATPIPMTVRTREWLALVKSAAQPEAPKPPPAPSNKFLAYCIELHADLYRLDRETLHFTPRVASRCATGVTVEPKVAAADPLDPAKYMVPEDIAICSRYHRRIRDSHQFTSLIRLRGSGWEEILPAALATERLLFGTPPQDRQSSKDFRVVTPGDTVAVETGWEIDPFGNARPVLKLPSATFQPILTDPPRYLDVATCQMGLLVTPLSASVLTAWHDGPRIPAGEVDALSRELVQITPDTPLSAPSEKPAKHAIGRNPLPFLEIREVLIGPYLKRYFGGVVSFHYPEMPPVGPLAADLLSSTHWLENGQRIVLERDRKAEAERFAQLRAHGILPLHEVAPAHDLTDKTRHAVTLGQLQTEAFPWLEFLESPACTELKTAGWTVSTHKKAGLIVHDVQEFFPTLTTDPSKTVDWFRFDVTAEFGGKRMTFVPQIARAIREDWLVRYAPPQEIPDTLLLACDKPSDGFVRFPARRFLEMLEQVRHLFEGPLEKDGTIRVDRLGAARIADALAIDDSETNESLAALGRNLRDIQGLPATPIPETVKAGLRPYQLDGFRWLQFLSNHGLHGILADDMGLGKTLQTLSHLAAQHQKMPGKPSLVVAPTSVVPNWAAEARKFTPDLKIVVFHGSDRSANYSQIPEADVVFTSYPLLARDIALLSGQPWHIVALDEAHYIKNPKAVTSRAACQLRADHRICLSGTPMENHLGELWSLMRFLMPGYLGDEKSFNSDVRKPIERDQARGPQLALNRRIAPLILRRTKDQVATELPAKTTLIHRIDLTPAQSDLYESVRAAMDDRVRHAITEKGLAKSHIIVLDALLKLRQICCHPQLLNSEAAQRVTESAKLEYLTGELLPTLIEEGRRILLFSQFTSMLALIEEHLRREGIPYLQLTGQTKDRATLVEKFQTGGIPVFLISLKAGGTGLNLTAADTIIHYDPWWNPATENQATDRAHRIGQTKPVFVHKLVCTGTIEERILELQIRKDKLVKALLSEETTSLKIDAETLSHLFGATTFSS